MKKEWKKNILGVVSIFLFGLFPCLVIYFRNVGESRIQDVALVMLLYLICDGILLALYWCGFRSFSKAIAITNVTMLFLCNYELLADFAENLMNPSYKYYLVSGVVIVLLAGIFFLIKWLKEDFVVELNSVFCVVMAVLIVSNFLPSFPAIRREMASKAATKQLIESEIEGKDIKLPESADTPNIYYMIFDEYGGYWNLKYLMDYDNAEFYDRMENRKFNYSKNSYNLESMLTMHIVPNLLNLDYVINEESTQDEREECLRHPYLYLLMKRLGYEVNVCSHVDYLYEDLSERSFVNHVYYEDLAGYFVLERGIFIHLYQYFAPKENNKSSSYAKDLLESIDFYKGLVDVAVEEEKPQFSIGYFACPHEPWVFKADGTPASPNVQLYEGYLQYLQWTTAQMEEMVDNILEKDPNAIIIIQSDHGQRITALENDEVYKQNILNCVYYKGEAFDIEGLSGINTLRKVLKQEFGLQMEMIEYQPGIVE